MSGKQTKQVRNEIRQLVKELLPQILQQELYKELHGEMKKTLNLVQERAEDSAKRMEERHSNIISMLMREFARPAQPEVLQKPQQVLSVDQTKLPPETI